MKKVLSLLLVFIILATLPVTTLNAATEKSSFKRPVYGDANHDHEVNLLDVLSMQRFIAKLNNSIFCGFCANLHDHGVNMADTVILQKYLAHLQIESICGEDAYNLSGIQQMPLDKRAEKKIAKAYLKTRTDLTEDDIERLEKDYGKAVKTEYYGTLSDGTMIVISNTCDLGALESIESMLVNLFRYTYSSSGSIHHLFCTNGEYKTMEEAIDEGLITNEVFEELAYHLHMKKIG